MVSRKEKGHLTQLEAVGDLTSMLDNGYTWILERHSI